MKRISLKQSHRARQKTISQANETDLAQSMTVNPQRRLISRPQRRIQPRQSPAERPAQSVKRVKLIWRNPFPQRKTLSIGQATEADTAQAITVSTAHVLSQAAEN